MHIQGPPPESDKALILHTMTYGDSDVILTLLGQRSGRINAFAKCAKKSKKKIGSGIMPGAIIDVMLNPPTGEGSLWKLKEIIHLEQWPWMSPQEERLIIKLAGTYLLDALKCFSQSCAPDDELFTLATLAMSHLHNTPDPIEFLCRFQLRLLLINGICPDFSTCSRCGEELLNNSCWPYGDTIVCPSCHRLLPVDPLTECPASSRHPLLALLKGEKPATHSLDLHTLQLTRELLSYHFQKQLKSALLLHRIAANKC